MQKDGNHVIKPRRSRGRRAAPPTVCKAAGRCPGLWCRLFRRCFQAEGA